MHGTKISQSAATTCHLFGYNFTNLPKQSFCKKLSPNWCAIVGLISLIHGNSWMWKTTSLRQQKKKKKA